MKFFTRHNFYIFILVIIIILNLILSFVFWAPGDLDCFLQSGLAAANHVNPYSTYAIHYSKPGSHTWNFNPPISLLFFSTISQFDLFEVFPIWTFISILFFSFSVFLLTKYYRPKIYQLMWVFAFSAFGDTLALGQIYIFLLLLISFAWILIHRKRDILAGLFIGLLIAFKPNFVIWPLFLFIIGRRKVSIVAVVSAIVYSLLPILVWGKEVYLQWLPIVFEHVINTNNISIVGLVQNLDIFWLKLPIMTVIVIISAVWVYFYKPSTQILCGIALLISLLASPVTWTTYTILLLPVFLSRHWSRGFTLAATLFLFPSGVINFIQHKNFSIALILGLVYTIGLLIILIDHFKINKEIPSGLF